MNKLTDHRDPLTFTCPVCRTSLIENKELELATLEEHVTCSKPSMKMSYISAGTRTASPETMLKILSCGIATANDTDVT